ncbi:MAG: ABC transporter ATP-binding protein [Micavibrio sp.]|nr:ABC transporter ATP-binding protein [Micavibrio sp.]
MSSLLLQCRGLRLERPGSPLLEFPDIFVKQNSRTLLLGPSGSGKTTLLSMIAGLLEPTYGEVLLDGKDFHKMPSSVRDHIRGKRFGFIFQTLHLLPSLTLYQNIALASDMAETEIEEGRLDNLLDTLGLADKAHRKPNALSQGEQQRGAIARAVLNKPAIILADEPTSALDDENAKTVIDLIIKQAQDSGAALIISTHDTRIINQFENIIRLDSQIKEAA